MKVALIDTGTYSELAKLARDHAIVVIFEDEKEEKPLPTIAKIPIVAPAINEIKTVLMDKPFRGSGRNHYKKKRRK